MEDGDQMGRVERWFRRVRNDGPLTFLLFSILFQTAAAACFAEALTRAIDGEWGVSAWALGWAVVLAVLAGVMWALRFDARKSGTALTLAVPRGRDLWRDDEAFKRAKSFSHRKNFLYYYPLRSPKVEPAVGAVANWSKAIDFHSTVLRSIFAADWGFDVDSGSRVLLSFAAPTAVAFEIGNQWDELTEGRAKSVQLLDVSGSSSRVLWTAPDRRPTSRLQVNEEWLSVPVVVLLLQRSVNHEPLEKAFGAEGTGYVVVGETVELGENDERIDRYISQLERLLEAKSSARMIGPDNKLRLVLLAAMPAAFAAGWHLRNFRNDVEILEFDHATQEYFEVDFGEGSSR